MRSSAAFSTARFRIALRRFSGSRAGDGLRLREVLVDGELDVTIWSGFRLMDFVRKRHSLYDAVTYRRRVLRCCGAGA